MVTFTGDNKKDRVASRRELMGQMQARYNEHTRSTMPLIKFGEELKAFFQTRGVYKATTRVDNEPSCNVAAGIDFPCCEAV